MPQQMRALIGDDREQLDAAAPRRIDNAIALLFRSGLLDAFETGTGTPGGQEPTKLEMDG